MDNNKKPRTFLDFPNDPLTPETSLFAGLPQIESMFSDPLREPSMSFEDMNQQIIADDVRDIRDMQLLTAPPLSVTKTSPAVVSNKNLTEPSKEPSQDLDTDKTKKSLTSQEYRDALKKAEDGKLIEGVTSSFETIAKALAGQGRTDTTPTASKGIADLYAREKNILDKEAERQKKEDELQSTDPQSDISKMYRNSLKELTKQGKLNIAIPENMTASQVKTMFPQLALVIDRQLRRDELSAIRSERFSQSKDRDTARKEAQQEKEFADLSKFVNKFSSREAVGRARNQIEQAERLEGLIYDEQGRVKDANKLNLAEAATGIATLVGASGAPAASTINKFFPETVGLSAAKLKEWVTSNPQKVTGSKEFLEMYGKIIRREKEIGREQVNREVTKRVTSSNPWQKADPEVRQRIKDQILDPLGIDTENIDEKGRYKVDPVLRKTQEQTPSTSSKKPSWAK
jgi:hypothetical protein